MQLHVLSYVFHWRTALHSQRIQTWCYRSRLFVKDVWCLGLWPFALWHMSRSGALHQQNFHSSRWWRLQSFGCWGQDRSHVSRCECRSESRNTGCGRALQGEFMTTPKLCAFFATLIIREHEAPAREQTETESESRQREIRRWPICRAPRSPR